MRASVRDTAPRGYAPGELAAAAQMACLLEASAPKPGNVSPGRPFSDTSYEDFVASAIAIGEPLRSAGEQPLGRTIRAAVDATRAWTTSNTNLGIILLLTPLAKGAADLHAHADNAPSSLRDSVATVLASTTVQDAKDAYAAIRTAAPGGLSQVEAQDVADEPSVDLRAAMRLAADRDTVAREWVTTFDTTFGVCLPTLTRARTDGLDWNDAIVETFLAVLASTPDTHIVRRAGYAAAAETSLAAKHVLEAGSTRSTAGRRAIVDLDTALRDPANRRNPGTSADLTTAALFVFLLGGGWRSPGRTHR